MANESWDAEDRLLPMLPRLALFCLPGGDLLRRGDVPNGQTAAEYTYDATPIRRDGDAGDTGHRRLEREEIIPGR